MGFRRGSDQFPRGAHNRARKFFLAPPLVVMNPMTNHGAPLTDLGALLADHGAHLAAL